MGGRSRRRREEPRGLAAASLAVVGELDLASVLRTVVESACELLDARYGALGVLAPDGDGLEEFIYVGLDDSDALRIGHPPRGRGLLGALIEDPTPIRLDHLGEDARSVGFPDGHPPMDSFLGVPIRVRDQVFGNLYLTDSRAHHFDAEDETLACSLAATAGVAIENARLFQESGRRHDWLQASTEITRQVLSLGDDAALHTIVETVHRLADADMVSLLQPVRDGAEVAVMTAVGEGTEQLVGERFRTAGTLTGGVLLTGEPISVEDAATARVAGSFLAEVKTLGPVMLVPLLGSTKVHGVLMTGRRSGRWPFSAADVEMATTFATHGSLALELAAARRDQERMTLVEERNRIAADLHDHVIQQLYAAGMTLQGVTAGLDDDARVQMVDRVVDTLDDAVKRIRTSIFQLNQTRYGAASLRSALLDLVEELVPALGFEPRVDFDGPVDAVSDQDLSEDALAVVREALSNTAKHARASSAAVGVHATASHFDIVVEDDGTGLTGDRRSGLANLQHRAHRRGGSLRVNDPAPDRGTRLVWSVPLG